MINSKQSLSVEELGMRALCKVYGHGGETGNWACPRCGKKFRSRSPLEDNSNADT